MEKVLLEEINRMRKLMSLTEKENLDELDSSDIRDDKWIINSLKKQLGGDKEIYVKLIDNRPGRENQTKVVKQTVNGDIISIEDDEPEPVQEGIKDTLKIGAVCFILASGLVSCQKEESYNLGKDARFILKPNILNTLGKESFDSPVGSKSKIYVWAGNQSGGRGSNSRVLYHDYSNQSKDYGAVYGQNYPDSFAYGANGITPVEVVVKTKLTSDIAKRLQKYSKIDLSQYTDTSTTLGKTDTKPASGLYVIVVEVLNSSHYEWADPSKGDEINDPKYKTGYAIYLVTPSVAEGINKGELYPTMMDIMFGTWNVSPNEIPGNEKIKALDNYMSNDFKNLLGDKPEF